jgi:hypothetical protein
LWLEHERANTRWRAGLREQVMPPPGERAIVFVDCWPLGLGEPDGMFWNHPSFADPVLFARNRGIAANLELRDKLYPDRPIFVGRARIDLGSFITEWDVLGPFYAPVEEALEQPWIDETRPDPSLPPPASGSAAAGAAGRAVAWRPFSCSPSVPVLDLGAAFAGRPQTDAAAYARAIIRAPRATRAVLRYGSDDGVAIWLNGEELAREVVTRAASFDQGQVEVTLRPGENHLLVKVSQAIRDWQLVVRVTDASGSRLPGIEYSTPLAAGAAPRVVSARPR